jgi:LmbE family N-acetylglucosaminyl deacetylase
MKCAALPLLKTANHTWVYLKALACQPRIRKQKLVFGFPPTERILIVAPHMDDEAIGCGGMIRLRASQGCRVACLYLTDGSRGHTGDDRDAYCQRRMEETWQAAKLLGMTALYFLHEPDGALRYHEELEQHLMAVLEREKPDEVFIPEPFDPHPDHQQAFRIFSELYPRLARKPARIYRYQIQSPLCLEDITTVLDISDVCVVKKQAWQVYRSQSEVPFEVIWHLQQCQRYLIGRHVQAVEVYGRLAGPEWTVPGLARNHRCLQVKRFSEVGIHAIRRKQWI